MSLLLEVLRTVEFLADEPPDAVAAFMGFGRTRTLSKGHVAWSAGDPPNAVTIPLDGEMASLGRDPGGRALCYAFFGTGDCAGLPSVLDGQPEARELRVIRGGDFFFVDRASLLRFLDAHPTARAGVVAAVSRRFRAGLDERDDSVFLPVHARVARFLLERACVRRSDGARILLRETQPEIAIRLGSVREVVAREMAAFADRGLIRRTRHAIFVVDWEGLRDAAECERHSECSCGDETAEARTRKFFLPAFSQGEASVACEASVCGEHLAGFRGCVARGCTLALAATADGHAPTPHPGRAAPGRDSTESKRSADAPRPANHEARGEHARHAASAHPHEEAISRSPAEQHEIERRVAVYRSRAAGIETQFKEDDVPSGSSVFRRNS